MEYICSSRGNPNLLYEGFVYVLDKKRHVTGDVNDARNVLADSLLC